MDIYEEVTRRIVEQMEQGEIPWRKLWIASGSCVSYASGKPYSLLNQMLLGKPGEYLTFRQCQQAGGHIRRGEKAHMVVFWKWIEQENEETGEKKQIPFLRYYNVFHINQCEGIAARHAKPLPQTADTDEAAVLSRVMRKYNSVTYEVGKAKAEQAAGMFGLAAGQRAASCPSRVAKPLAKPLTGGWRSATYARSQQSAPCFSRSICSSDFMLM